MDSDPVDCETVNKISALWQGPQTDHRNGSLRSWIIHYFLKLVLSARSNPIVSDNIAIVAIAVAYILAVYGVHAFFGIHDKVVLVIFSDLFVRFVFVFSAIFIGLHLPQKSYRRYFSPRYLIGFLIIVVLAFPFKCSFASYKQTIPLIHNFDCDVALMKLDQMLHFGYHPWQLLAPILAHPRLIKAIDVLYMLWFLVLFLFCLWMAWTQRRRLRICFFVSTILVWGLLGSGLGTLLSSAGPCYYSKIVPASDNPFVPLMQRLSEISHSTFLWSAHNQIGLWEAKESAVWLPFGGISAMPSIHLAMATIFALLALRVHKWLGVVFIGYLCIMQIGSVILGWHYAIDGYVGIILASLIWYVVGRLVKQDV